MQTEPSFPHPIPALPVIESLLARLEAPDASREPGIDEDIRNAFSLPDGLFGPYVTDLDAALALTHAVLPGWSIDMQAGRFNEWPVDGGGTLSLFATVSEWRGGQFFKALTPPCIGPTMGLSVCIALFSVIKARILRDGHF